MKKSNYSLANDTKHTAVRNARFSNFTGDSSGINNSGSLGSFSRTLTVKIVNATTAQAAYVVFGYNVYGDAANAGCDTGVTVTVTQSSGPRASRALANSPMELAGAKMKTTNASNFDNDITKYYKPMTGNGSFASASPLNYFDPFQNQSLLITIPDFDGLTFGGDDYLTGNIDAGTTITLILTMKSLVQTTDALNDNSVIKVNGNPAPGNIKPLYMSAVSAAPMQTAISAANAKVVPTARPMVVGSK